MIWMDTSDQAGRAHGMRAMVDVDEAQGKIDGVCWGREKRRKKVEAVNFWTRTSRRVVFI
jgi:hypothetical protein